MSQVCEGGRPLSKHHVLKAPLYNQNPMKNVFAYQAPPPPLSLCWWHPASCCFSHILNTYHDVHVTEAAARPVTSRTCAPSGIQAKLKKRRDTLKNPLRVGADPVQLCCWRVTAGSGSSKQKRMFLRPWQRFGFEGCYETADYSD